MRKIFLLLLSFFIFSVRSDAQFKKLINKAKQKAVEAVTGKEEEPDSDQPNKSEPGTVSQPEVDNDNSTVKSDEQLEDKDDKQTETPKPIVFPVTGETVTAMHAVFAPVIDGDIKKITDSPQGQYMLSIARQKGLKGSDMEIFRQLMDPKNQELAEEISDEVEKKFPRDKNQKENVSGNVNPANGGFSTPSLYFEYMVGSFDMWLTDQYIKVATKHTHFTMADAFGVNVISITDLPAQKAYNISSVLGVNYTNVLSLDTVNRPYGPLSVMPLFKDQYQGIQGIKIEPGEPEKFGEFNCTTIKIIIPVRPYMDKETHQQNNSLLSLHDILSNREDASAHNGQGNWDPSYQIIYKGYFSHDIEKYLPEKVKEMVQHLKWKQGIGVGAAIADEKGNSADFRMVDITNDNKLDKGQFQIPDGYPVMTQDEVNQAVKKQFSVKKLMLKGLKNSASDSDN